MMPKERVADGRGGEPDGLYVPVVVENNTLVQGSEADLYKESGHSQKKNEEQTEEQTEEKERSAWDRVQNAFEFNPADQPKMNHLVPTNDDEVRIVNEAHGQNSWQAKALHVVHQDAIQKFLMGLLLLDVLILFCELYLSAEFPTCKVIKRDALSCYPVDHSQEGYDEGYGDDGHRFLGGGGGGPLCPDPYTEVVSYPAGCDPNKHEALHYAHLALFYITLAILSSFMIELAVLIVCLGPLLFFSYAFYVLDFIVVYLSFSLEVAFHIINNESLSAVAGMLVVIRIWRFARIGHGLVKATVEMESKKNKKVVQELEDLLRANNIPFESKMEKSIKMGDITRKVKSLRSKKDVFTEEEASEEASAEGDNFQQN